LLLPINAFGASFETWQDFSVWHTKMPLLMQKTPTIAHFPIPPAVFNAHFSRIRHVTTCFTHHYFTSCHEASPAYHELSYC
jgi:hypothetical protein